MLVVVVPLQVKYKEDLEWLKGLGCFVWDTPELVQAERNKTLYSEVRGADTQLYSQLTFSISTVKQV